MKKFFVSLFAAVVVLLGQEQPGSVKIAEAIRPAADAELDKFATCVERLVKIGFKPDKGAEKCQKVAETASKTTTRVANEAADATKASRPLLLNPYSGYFNGGVINTVEPRPGGAGWVTPYSYRR